MDQGAQADRPDGRGKQRMTIRHGFRDDIRADAAPRTWPIFRHDGLPQAFRKPLRHQPPDLIRCLSWRPWHHQANGARWPCLRHGWPDQKWQRCHAKCATVDHDAFPHPEAILTHWRVSASGCGAALIAA